MSFVPIRIIMFSLKGILLFFFSRIFDSSYVLDCDHDFKSAV